MISHRKTTPNDIFKVCALAKKEFKSEGTNASYLLSHLSHGLPLFTIVNSEDEPLCILGAAEVWPGVSEVASVFTNDVYLYSTSVGRYVKRFFRKYLAHCESHRVQATARANFAEAHKFLKFLGFEQEAVLVKYGQDKSDYIMFRKVL